MDRELEEHANQCGCCPRRPAHSLVSNGVETEANAMENGMWEEAEVGEEQ